MMKNTANQYNNQQGVYIQNILAGPLVMCDPPHMKNGLYLDPIQPGEVLDLSYYDPQVLARSIALNNAVKNGYVDILSEEEYYEQIDIAEERQAKQADELARKIGEAQAGGGVFEAEQINLATAGNPHGDYSAEAILAQKNSINNQSNWSTEYRAAKAQGLVRDPIEFKELVDQGRIATNLGSRGRRVSVAEMQNIGAQDQMTMTSTRATIAMPGSYTVQNDDGSKDEMGGVFTQKRQLTNFNATGSMVGAGNMAVEDNANPSYVTNNMRRAAAAAAAYEEDNMMAEVQDLNQDDEEYEAALMAEKANIAERFAPRSPYLGQKALKPNMRR